MRRLRSFSLRSALALIVVRLGSHAAAAQTPSAQQPAPPAPVPPPVTAGFQDGLFLQSADGTYRLVLELVAQADGRFSVDDPTPITNTFTVRKLRPTFSGRVGRYFDFKVMPDFGNGSAVVQDLYLEVRFSPAFRIRSGKDKTPVGYELLIGDGFLFFPERALASSLVPNRDIGVQAQGDLEGGKIFYAAGVFNGIPDGTSSTSELDTNNGKDLSARLVLQPFRSATTPGALNGLGIHIGGSTGRQVGSLPSFKTSVTQTYFSYDGTAVADGRRNRISPAVFYYYKAFGGFAEYMRSTQRVTRGVGHRDVTNDAWEVTGSIVLTGEPVSDRNVRPRNNFDPAAGHWGALQILGRYTELSIDREVFSAGFAAIGASRQARSFTLAANWYPNMAVKYYFTFERTVFGDGGAGPRPAEDVILFRTQLGF
jgi:phosphate-selective porin OprO/OprP